MYRANSRRPANIVILHTVVECYSTVQSLSRPRNAVAFSAATSSTRKRPMSAIRYEPGGQSIPASAEAINAGCAVYRSRTSSTRVFGAESPSLAR
jgi:hypothetical protein